MFRTLATTVAAVLAAAAVYVYLQPDELPPKVPYDTGLSGPEVAERYCQSCHLLPAPEQLPKETWPFVIDWMGNYLGFAKTYEPYGRITDESLIPAAPLVSAAEMTRLGQYLIGGASHARDFRIDRDENPPLAGYAAKPSEAVARGKVVTLVHVDEEAGLTYVGVSDPPTLHAFDRSGRPSMKVALDTDPIHFEKRPGGFRITGMGDFERDRQRAQVVDFSFARDESGEPTLRRRMLVAGFHRAPQTHTRDIDGDGREDLVLVGFGDGVGQGHGKVSVLWATDDFTERFEAAPERIEGPFLEGAFDEQVLLDRAGALGAQLVDIDGDGRLDVLILSTQGTNQLTAHLNRGERRFERRTLIEEHASYGFNEFHVLDFDGDGALDLVTVNGNNMEMPDPPLRPYHGVRILLGDGALGFDEAFFYPMYGALTALIRDLDGDGDLDLGVNAFYPDWHAESPETFTILENRGDFDFAPTSLVGEHWGRWLRIAAGDANGDGRVDLVLGAGNIPGGGLHPGRPRLYQRYRERLETGVSLLFLERL